MVADQAKHDQLRDHIAGLQGAAKSVELAAARRPNGSDRDNMEALAFRLRQSADSLQTELEDLRRPPSSSPALYHTTNRD